MTYDAAQVDDVVSRIVSVVDKLPPGQWHCSEQLVAFYTKATAKEIERRLRVAGYEVLREKRMTTSYQRLRGCWVRKKP